MKNPWNPSRVGLDGNTTRLSIICLLLQLLLFKHHPLALLYKEFNLHNTAKNSFK